MNASTMSTTFHSTKRNDFNGSYSEKSCKKSHFDLYLSLKVSPVKRSVSPIGKRLEDIQNQLNNTGMTKVQI